MQSIKFYNILYKGRKKGGIFQRAKNTQNKKSAKADHKRKSCNYNGCNIK